jgi:Uma2 family endonuclease
MSDRLAAFVHETVREKISFEDYLRQYENFEGGRTEWLAGEVAIYPMPNNVNHNSILSFLDALFRLYLGLRNLGRVVIAGVPMKYSDTLPAREPDLMILLNEHLDRLKSQYVDGVADIAVEVVSPESIGRDHVEKFKEFEAAGVREYWIIDPLRQDAVIWALDNQGRYRRVLLDNEGRLISTLLPGFALDPAMLWRDVLPDGAELIALAQAMA